MAHYEGGQPSTSALSSTGLFSPPPTAASHQRTASSSVPDQNPQITAKSHRLRTSPLANEGTTFVPVVKFTQSFSQRNALSSLKPAYGPTSSTDSPKGKGVDINVPITAGPGGEGEVVAVPRIGGPGRGDASGWTISITSSSPTEDEIQVEVQQHLQRHFETQTDSHRFPHAQHPSSQSQQRTGGLLGGVAPGLHSPNFPLQQIPTLTHDRIVLTKEDLQQIKVKSIIFLMCGLVFPPIWAMMGWGHMLDAVILPHQWMMTTKTQQQHIIEVYRPYRIVASVLGGVVIVGCMVGIVFGGLALGGVIG